MDFLLDMGILKLSIKLNKMEKMKQENSKDEEEEENYSDPFSQDFQDTNPVEAYMDTTMKYNLCPSLI